MSSDGNGLPHVVCADVAFDARVPAMLATPRSLGAKLAHAIHLHPAHSHQATWLFLASHAHDRQRPTQIS